jgi:hypothetical protein
MVEPESLPTRDPTTAYFGVSLKTLVESSGHRVPYITRESIDAVEMYGGTTGHIYGGDDQIEGLKALFQDLKTRYLQNHRNRKARSEDRPKWFSDKDCTKSLGCMYCYILFILVY